MYSIYNTIDENLLETIEFNAPTTPIKATPAYNADYPNGSFPAHWHGQLECVVVMEGSVNYYVNDKTYLLQKGQGLIVNANRIHSSAMADEGGYATAILLLHPNTLRFHRKMEEKYIDPLIYDKKSDVFFLDKSETWHEKAIKHIMSIYRDVTKEKPCFELTAQSTFFDLWKTLYENTIALNGFEYEEADPLSPLKKMISFVQNNYQESLTLSVIAKEGHMCQSKCCRLFKENLRQSPMEYLQGFRIQKAAYLLEHTDMNITEIALETGFHGASYFTETFRKVHGVSPREYRKGNS